MKSAHSSRIPAATYRLQFHRDFTFQQGVQIIDYLSELGITDCYASPPFTASAGSIHGYDICRLDELNPELGGKAGFDRLAGRLRELKMGLLLDMVPNHMAANSCNPWWWDVLEHGRASPHASWFDIDWRPLDPETNGKVLLPVLEDECGKVLEAGKLKLVEESGSLKLSYYDRKFPVSAAQHTPGQKISLDRLGDLLRRQHYRLAFWKDAPEKINYRRFFDITELVCLRVELPEVFQATHRLLFSLVREGKVNGLRIDHPDGLSNPKQYFVRLQEAAGSLTEEDDKPRATTGEQARPLPFFIVAEKILTGIEALPDDWPVAGTSGYEFLNLVNGLFVDRGKLASFDKVYREFTGSDCDFRTLVYSRKKQVLQTSFPGQLAALVHRLEPLSAKAGRNFTFQQLQAVLAGVIAGFPVYRTYIAEDTREVPAPQAGYIREAVRRAATLETGVDSGALEFIQDLLLLNRPPGLGESDRAAALEFVMQFQQLCAPVMAKGLEDTAFYNFNRLLSLNEVGSDPECFGVSLEQFHQTNLDRAQRWPHSLLATATHDTKRGEDVRARLNVLSEIPEEWREVTRRWKEMNAARKQLVAGAPAPSPNDEFALYQTLVGSATVSQPGRSAPENPARPSGDLNEFSQRVAAYMLKAIREAKTHTSWTEPNAGYEEATLNFVETLLTESSDNRFLQEFKTFQQRVAFFGQFNSLSQVLLKSTAPGVPDFYQGTELWDLSLVDPDNRRPVDFEVRRRWLKELKHQWSCISPPEMVGTLMADISSAKAKLFVTWRALEFRRAHRELFERGAYVPLSASGPKREHVCAFARVLGKHQAIVVTPRLVVGLLEGKEQMPLGEIWRDTSLPLEQSLAPGQYRNVFTDEILSADSPAAGLALAQMFSLFPVALLQRVNEPKGSHLNI